MDSIPPFAWGALGSAFADVFALYVRSNKNGEPLPERYGSVLFWVTRACLALGSGCLVVAYGIDENPLVAINIGVAAPTILTSIAGALKRSLDRNEALVAGAEDPLEVLRDEFDSLVARMQTPQAKEAGTAALFARPVPRQT